MDFLIRFGANFGLHGLNKITVIYTITPLSERKDWSTKQEVASALLVYITVLISLRVQPSATVVECKNYGGVVV